MQIVHVSDTHLGAKPYHINRLQEHVIEAFDTVIDYVIETRPRVMIIAGDVIDRPRPETQILLHLVRKLKEVTERGVIVILAHGEHDTPGRRDKTLLEVLSEAIDGVYAPRITGSTLEERVAKSMIQIDDTTIGVYQFVKTHVERQREYAKSIMPLYEKAFSRVNGRKVFVAHIGVEGTLIEYATHVNPRDLPSVDYAALGHHHGRWYWKRDGSQGPLMAVYPGSLYPLTIREARSSNKRGPILVDLSGDEPVIQEEYNVEVAKHIVTRELTIPTPEYIKVEQRLREIIANAIRGINKDAVLHVPVKIGITVSRAKIESIFIKLSRQMNKIIIPHIRLTTIPGESRAVEDVIVASVDPVEIIKTTYKVSEETAKLILALKDALASGDVEAADSIIDELTQKGELLKLANAKGLR